MAASPGTIRQATRADLLAIYRIERASFPQPWPYQAIEQFLGEPGFLVATPGLTNPVVNGPPDADQTRVLGYIIADTTPHPAANKPLGHIKDLAVHPDHRGQRVASRLLEHGIARLAHDGARYVKLEVRPTNQPALSLYAKYGFESRQVLAGYYEDGEDALVLVTDLTNPPPQPTETPADLTG